MKITRTSWVSGITRTLDLPVTEAQFIEWEGGKLVQDAFPNLDPDQREFLMSGVTADEWDGIFAEKLA